MCAMTTSIMVATEMVRDLETARRRFEIAEVLQVHSVAVGWAEFEGFNRALRAANKEIKKSESQVDYSIVIQQLWRLNDTLATTPLDPNTQSLEGIQLFDHVMALNGGALDSWGHLCTATEALLSVEHPVKKLQRLLNEHGLASLLDNEKVAVVAPKKFASETRRQLEVEDLEYELVTLRELRMGGVWDTVVLLGTQVSRFLQFQTSEQAAQEVAWLYSAPAAENTVVVTWSGGQRFDISQYGIRSEIVLPGVREYGFGTPMQWGSPRRRVVKDVRPQLSADVEGYFFIIEGPETVSGEGSKVRIDRGEGEWVVPFAKVFRPRPQLLEADDYGLSIRAIEKPSNFPIGGILVVREDLTDTGDGSYDPERDEVRKIARAALRGKYDQFRAASERFKAQMADAAKRNESHNRLREAGFQHPLYYLRIHANPQYIGPGTYDIYKRLCVALRITEQTGVYEAIESIRSEHRSAGFEITNRIRKRLEMDRDWEESCRTEHFAVIEGTGFGRVVLAKVLAINESMCESSELGLRKFVIAESPSNGEEFEAGDE